MMGRLEAQEPSLLYDFCLEIMFLTIIYCARSPK
jgi:prolipoprotein diacylglyceryltransferase